MNSLLELWPWLLAMVVLIGLSAFFSGSEAALFLLRVGDRRRLESGTTAQRVAAQLLRQPDRLLSAVLFWNLVVNVIYFALSSAVALRMQNSPQAGQVLPLAFAFGSLITIIFCSEMLPKSLAVIRPMTVTRMVSIPLSLSVRAADPVMPLLRGATLLSRRLVWPGFQPEPYMELGDLERAIQISSQDQGIIEQETAVLRNIVRLSDIRIDEWMRPRTQFQVFQPPVSLDQLGGSLTPSGYLLVSEPGSDEIENAFRLDSVTQLNHDSIDTQARPVIYLPWKATVADALEQMSREGCEVTAAVNEFGETIGILTIKDILEAVFVNEPSRTKRLLDLNPIQRIAPHRWAVSGMTSLRRLARRFGEQVPETRSVTVAGVIQESLQRLARPGDRCQCGPFKFEVREISPGGTMLVELHYEPDTGTGEAPA